MTTQFGMPIWYDLMTPDTAAATRFYGDVVGWTTSRMDAPGDYTLWHADDGTGVGGMMALPEGMPGGLGWSVYFHVANVDAAIADVEAAGGAVIMPPQDVPGAGRFARIADPQGVTCYVMTPQPTEPRETVSFSPTLPQRCAWNELVTTDQDAALAFYARLFGWTSTSSMPMGAMGDYHFLDCGDVQIGGMMNRPSPDQPARWSAYFHIRDVDAAVATITAGGGQVVMGPMDVPGGQRILVAIDPQGAPVGFVSGDAA